MEVVINGFKEKQNQWSKDKPINFKNRFGGLISAFFLFDVEIIVFAALNVWQPITEHWVLAFSFTISIFYMLLVILSIPFIFVVTNKPPQILENEAYKKEFESLYEGMKIDDGVSKHFRAFSMIRFLFFGLVLVFFYYMPLLQITLSFLIAVIYLGVLIKIQPHEEIYEYRIELFTESMFSLGNFMFLLLVLDDNYQIMSIGKRVFIGWIIFWIYVLALVVSIGLVIYEIIQLVKKIKENCSKKKEDDKLEVEKGIEDKPKETEMSRLKEDENEVDNDIQKQGNQMISDRIPLNENSLNLKRNEEEEIDSSRKLDRILNSDLKSSATKRNSKNIDKTPNKKDKETEKVMKRLRDEEKELASLRKEFDLKQKKEKQRKERSKEEIMKYESLKESKLSGLEKYKKGEADDNL